MATIQQRVIEVVQRVINDHGHDSVTIETTSTMGNPSAWDSMVFVEVFDQIGKEFSLDLSDDDAVHFMSITEIVEFINATQ